ncbi:MAG: alpha/beta fold hydrolase [Pseudomonadales bacterium]
MPLYEDYYYQSSDGLRLYARDYSHPAPAQTIVCLHGLTRNAADFDEIAALLADEHRVIVPEQRGRGRSQYDPDSSRYQLPTYVKDMFDLLAELQLEQVVLLGTSMGGLMAMLMTASRPGLAAKVILNDVGPVVAQAGLTRIQGYVGKTEPVKTWADAIDQAREHNVAAFPDYADEDWNRFARALYRESSEGQPVLAYDPAIAQPLAASAEAAVPTDLWSVFDAMAGVPLLLIRGALSDILDQNCVEQMRKRRPDLGYVEVPNRGHAPMLNEAICVENILDFLRDGAP